MEYPITEFPTKEQIADNKVIAAFMELTIITDGISWFDTDYKPLKKYHSDWNDLMPVWKKCKDIGLFMMTNGHESLWLEKSKEIENSMVNEINCSKSASKISQLVKWYNENKV